MLTVRAGKPAVVRSSLMRVCSWVTNCSFSSNEQFAAAGVPPTGRVAAALVAAGVAVPPAKVGVTGVEVEGSVEVGVTRLTGIRSTSSSGGVGAGFACSARCADTQPEQQNRTARVRSANGVRIATSISVPESESLLSLIEWMNDNVSSQIVLMGSKHVRGWMELELDNRTFLYSDDIRDLLKSNKYNEFYLLSRNSESFQLQNFSSNLSFNNNDFSLYHLKRVEVE